MSDLAQQLADLSRRGALEQVVEQAQTALQQQPGSLPVLLQLAYACCKRQHHHQALEAALRILHAPDLDLNHRVYGTRILCISAAALGLADWALPYVRSLERALAHWPHANDRCWPGRLLLELDEAEQALAQFNAVCEQFAHDSELLRVYIGDARKRLGDSAGWHDLLAFSRQAFWRAHHAQAGLLESMWQGQPLQGRSLAVVSDGGYGDFFQFSRYVRFLKSAGAREVVVVAPPNCQALLLSAGYDRVLGLDQQRQARQAADHWCGSFGLEHARLLGAPLGAAAAYLHPPATAAADAFMAQVQQRAQGKPCVALYWHSEADSGETRSLPLHAVMPLLQRTDVHWVLLQRGYGLRQWLALRQGDAVSVLPEAMNFDETAGVVARLDAVISIDAWPVHLAAGMGVRTWLLASRALDQRHENRERESVLYPGILTLARQPRLGDWPGAVQRLGVELDAWLHGRLGSSHPAVPVAAA